MSSLLSLALTTLRTLLTLTQLAFHSLRRTFLWLRTFSDLALAWFWCLMCYSSFSSKAFQFFFWITNFCFY
jgi:hypothetical protein